MEATYTLRQVAEVVWPQLRGLLNLKDEKGKSPFDARLNYRLAKLAKPFQETMKDFGETHKALAEKHGIKVLKEGEKATDEQLAAIAAAQKEIDALLLETEVYTVTPVEIPEQNEYVSGAVLLDLDGLITVHATPELSKVK